MAGVGNDDPLVGDAQKRCAKELFRCRPAAIDRRLVDPRALGDVFHRDTVGAEVRQLRDGGFEHVGDQAIAANLLGDDVLGHENGLENRHTRRTIATMMLLCEEKDEQEKVVAEAADTTVPRQRAAMTIGRPLARPKTPCISQRGS